MSIKKKLKLSLKQNIMTENAKKKLQTKIKWQANEVFDQLK